MSGVHKISVLICVYNVEKYIHECIKSLLIQSVKDFEIVIVDDGSIDNTRNIIEDFDDTRIRYFRNKENIGMAKSRNKCINLSKGEIIFFTDGDCVLSKDWIEQGLRLLKTKRSIGVEGRTYYVSENYTPTFSDNAHNTKKGEFQTCNIAYKKKYVERIGGFDERFLRMSDRDLALRVMKLGRIDYNPFMIVHHQKRIFSPMEFVQKGKWIEDRVLLYKKHKDQKNYILWRIFFPLRLISILFPPLILGSLLRNRYKTKEDFVLFPFNYILLIFERLNLWHTCARNGVFLI